MFERDVLRQFSGSSTLPVVVQSDNELDIQTLREAIVMLHASWSGPSKARLQYLASASVPRPRAWLYIVNIDEISQGWLEQHFGGPAHGRGETFWIRDGEIEERDVAGGLQRDELIAAVEGFFAP